MSDRSQSITDAIIETSSQLAETIVTRADEVNSTLKSTGESLVLDLSLRGGDVVSKLEQTGYAHQRHHRHPQQPRSPRPSARPPRRSPRPSIPRATRSTRCCRPGCRRSRKCSRTAGRELAEKIARDIDHARQPDHPPSRRVRPHGEDLRRRAGRAARASAPRKSPRRCAPMSTISTAGHHQGHRGRPDARPAPARFQEALDSRTQTLNDVLGCRVMEIAKTLAEGGKEVVTRSTSASAT